MPEFERVLVAFGFEESGVPSQNCSDRTEKWCQDESADGEDAGRGEEPHVLVKRAHGFNVSLAGECSPEEPRGIGHRER